jgi:hypothetical protein
LRQPQKNNHKKARTMSETPVINLLDLDFDPDALRDKYRTERDKRLRQDGNDQYQEVLGDFSRYIDDPYVEPGFSREPLTDTMDVVVIGGGFGGLLTGARLREAGIGTVIPVLPAMSSLTSIYPCAKNSILYPARNIPVHQRYSPTVELSARSTICIVMPVCRLKSRDWNGMRPVHTGSLEPIVMMKCVQSSSACRMAL